jgi:YlmC/YmxH family sporulation protein
MIKSSDLRQKEVINIKDGKKLGNIYDLEINLVKGRVDAIIIPGQSKFFSFFSKEEDYVIPWKYIRKIGIDTIIVDINEHSLSFEEKEDVNF